MRIEACLIFYDITAGEILLMCFGRMWIWFKVLWELQLCLHAKNSIFLFFLLENFVLKI